jgi:hypothetical protein
MLLVFLVLAASPQPAADMPVVNPQQSPANCPETHMSFARKQAERPRAIPLNRLPRAEMFAAVDRRIDHCPAPLIISKLPKR